jgi:H+-transporting ATPase
MWAGFVWAYALAWFLINDRVKLLAYRIFDPTKAPLLVKKPPVDLTQQIAARAYEIYQDRLHGETLQDQDWLEAEREGRRGQTEHPKLSRGCSGSCAIRYTKKHCGE